MPKYAYKESPLHLQKETPIKIGHPYMLNSTYVKWYFRLLFTLFYFFISDYNVFAFFREIDYW